MLLFNASLKTRFGQDLAEISKKYKRVTDRHFIGSGIAKNIEGSPTKVDGSIYDYLQYS